MDNLKEKGLTRSTKTNLNFLKKSEIVEKFPSKKKIPLKKPNNEITQLFFARNIIITEEMGILVQSGKIRKRKLWENNLKKKT